MQVSHIEASQLMGEVISFFEERGIDLSHSDGTAMTFEDFTALIEVIHSKDGKRWSQRDKEWKNGTAVVAPAPASAQIGHHTEGHYNHPGLGSRPPGSSLY